MNKLREILFLKSVKGIRKAKIYRKYWHYLEKGMNMDELEKSVASEESGLAVSDISSARETSERLYESLRIPARILKNKKAVKISDTVDLIKLFASVTEK